MLILEPEFGEFLESLEKFEVYEVVKVENVPEEDVRQAMDLRWAHTWKNFVKSRLCVRGFNQNISDLDDTYASTPTIWVLYFLFTIGLSSGWSFFFCDVTTAFLHA